MRPHQVLLFLLIIMWAHIVTIITALLSGGVITSLFTLRASRRAAAAAARAAELSNIENSNRILIDSIVKPLQVRIEENEKEIKILRLHMKLIYTCPHLPSCPVRLSAVSNS